MAFMNLSDQLNAGNDIEAWTLDVYASISIIGAKDSEYSPKLGMEYGLVL